MIFAPGKVINTGLGHSPALVGSFSSFQVLFLLILCELESSLSNDSYPSDYIYRWGVNIKHTCQCKRSSSFVWLEEIELKRTISAPMLDIVPNKHTI